MAFSFPLFLFQKECIHLHNWSPFSFLGNCFEPKFVLIMFHTPWNWRVSFKCLAEPGLISVYGWKNLCCSFWPERMLLKVHSWVFGSGQRSSSGHWKVVPGRTKVCSNTEGWLCVLRTVPRCPWSLSIALHGHLWVVAFDSLLAYFLLMTWGSPVSIL